MKRTILYVVLGIVVVAVIGVVIWQSRVTAPVEGQILSTAVERGMVSVTVSASGSIEPQARVNLGFEVPGRVIEVPVEVGDTVRAGDVLARLDSEHLALQVRQAQAALAAAEAGLAQAQAGARSEEIAALNAALDAMQAQVSAAAANRDQLEAGASDAQVAAAEAEMASAITQQKIAEDAHDMAMTCVTINRYGQEMEICPALGPFEEQARYGRQAADKALVAAQAGLDETLAGADEDQIRAARASVWAAAAQRDAAQAQLDLALAGASEEQIAAVEAQVAQARAALDIAELALERATLYAPFDGVVAAVNVTAGQMTGGGIPAITLIDNSCFHVDVEVDEIDVAQLSEGQPVEVMLDALLDVVLGGTIERIAPAAGGLGSTVTGMAASMGAAGLTAAGAGVAAPGVVSYDVTIALNATDAPVRAGMSANATVIVEEVTDALLVPTWVVRFDRDTGQPYVQRRVWGQTERVDIQLGVRGNGVVQVLSGLEEGEEVVLIQEEMIEVIREEMR
ncbi:MAG: efflux RND transporter periplasmic adaptor subunit [Chloroflexota bacterium]|nr:efflux RND transporter periplasmic adaptor subunit [Chloroflexota bacterium]